MTTPSLRGVCLRVQRLHSRLWNDSFGILAVTPAFLKHSKNIVPVNTVDGDFTQAIKSRGLRIKLPLFPADEPEKYIAILQYQSEDSTGEFIGITLIRNSDTGIYWRTLALIQTVSLNDLQPTKPHRIFISKSFYRSGCGRHKACWIQLNHRAKQEYYIEEIFPPRVMWNRDTMVAEPILEMASQRDIPFCWPWTDRYIWIRQRVLW